MEVFDNGQLQQTVEAPDWQKREQEGFDRRFRDLHHLDGKLSKGQNIQTDVLCKIYKVLNCDFKDIMEYIPD